MSWACFGAVWGMFGCVWGMSGAFLKHVLGMFGIQSWHCTRTTVVPARVLVVLVGALFLSCLGPFRGRTEGLFDTDVHVASVHGGHPLVCCLCAQHFGDLKMFGA